MNTLTHIVKTARTVSLPDVLLVTLGSFLIAVCAQLSVTIPFLSPVPFTLQNHAVFLLAALLGPSKAFYTVCLYLLEGAAGLPVFTHGRSSLLHLIGPNGGYLLSYLPASYLIGILFEKFQNPTWSSRVAFITLGSAMTIASGMLWLSAFIGFENAWKVGAYPFLGTCMVKTLILATLLPVLNTCLRRFVR